MALELETQRQIGNEMHIGSTYDRAVSYLARDARGRRLVIPEGPPVYLWPHDMYPTQNWNHPAFRHGWHFVEDLTKQITDTPVRPAILIDEFNNAQGKSAEEKLERVYDLLVSVPQAMSSVYPVDSQHLLRWESSYAVGDSQLDVCSNMDANFQFEKMVLPFQEGLVTNQTVNTLLIVVVHPTTFQQQQLDMIARLRTKMSEAPVSSIARKYRSEVLSNIYRHVWMDEIGNVQSVTRPVMNNYGTWLHEEVQL